MATIQLKEAKRCDQCGGTAVCYAIDSIPGGWGGHYCDTCARNLRFQIVDRYTQPGEAR